MHAVKVDSRKIMAAGLVIVAVFAAVAITVNLFYLGQIQSLVRNTTTTSVMELATARARYLDECLTSDQNSVKSLAHFIADITPQEARDQVKDFISTHEAAAAWIRSKDGTTWCSSSETDLYDPALEDELFGPAMAGETGSSEMYLGHAGERRILFYAPIVDEPVASGPGTTTTPADPDDVLGAVYVSYPADELQNSYGTAYSSAGATFVVDSSGTIVLDANRGADEAVQGSLSALINDNADSAQVSSLLAGIASDTSGSLVMTLDGADQFVFYTPIDAKSGWSLVTILPLSVVESDGTQIVGITNQMVAVLAVAVAVAAAAMVALMVYRRRREHRYEQYIQSVYSAIGANIDTAIFIVDRKERLIEAVFENTQDILGIPARDFFVPNELSPNEAYANVAAIVHSGAGDKARTWEFEADNPALGRSQWLRMTARPVMLAEREKTIFSLTDVTADHEIRARLERAATAAEDANRAKSSFLSSMSHDIRTPMNAIVGFTTLAASRLDQPEKVEEYLNKIKSSSTHLLSLINDILDMSHIESGKVSLDEQPYNLVDLLDDLYSIIQAETSARQLYFSINTESVRHTEVRCDKLRINQILLNLLGNALKFTNPGGFIKVTLDELPGAPVGYGRYRFTVSDTGIGMSPEFVEHIFDPFERERTSTISGIQGTGLGMAIAKNLVDMMHGTISVKSTQGKGTSFTVELTLQLACEGATAAAQEAKTQHVDPSHRLRHSRILLVDDNDLNREIAITLLEDEGFTVEYAVNGCEAVEKIMDAPSGHYQLVLMDVQMPVMNGYEATKAIRRLNDPTRAQVPILAMTADAFEEDRQKALRSGMNGHLTKPVEIDKLFKALDELLS